MWVFLLHVYCTYDIPKLYDELNYALECLSKQLNHVVASLRHLTRFTILSYIRRDHIDQLPLPRTTINYLLEKQCYIESLEDFEEAFVFFTQQRKCLFTSLHQLYISNCFYEESSSRGGGGDGGC
ncbi:unnamed protein product [Trichobilharzia regenti]|nr:unnamed protein product [Trichobilharzia regenti]